MTLVSAGITTNAAILTDGLVLHYSMDNDAVSGSVLTDNSNEGNDGEIYGATTGANGIKNEALFFDGTDDYVSGPDDSSLDVENALTVSLWTYRTGTGDQNPRVWTKGGWNTAYSFLQDGGFIDGDESMSFNVTDSGGTTHQIDDSNAIPLDTWTHYVGVYDGEEQRLYRDNTVVASTTWSDTINTNAGDVFISRNAGAESDFFEGRIDEGRIYDRALSDSEIQTLFEEGG